MYKFLGRPIVQWWTMNYSTTTCTLIDIILALHWSVCRIPMINSVPKPCIVSFHRRCNVIKAINRHACIALGQLIMTSLTKQITAPQILSITKLETLASQPCVSQSPTYWSQPSRPLWYENVHRNHVGTVGHCDVTIASGQQLFTFWNRIEQ